MNFYLENYLPIKMIKYIVFDKVLTGPVRIENF